MEKSIQVSLLLDVYGRLLTNKQRDIVDLYYNDNLSLSEIAEELGITRQGVHKNLIDAESKLYGYEEKLMLLKVKTEKRKELEKIIEKIDNKNIKEELRSFLQKM